MYVHTHTHTQAHTHTHVALVEAHIPLRCTSDLRGEGPGEREAEDAEVSLDDSPLLLSCAIVASFAARLVPCVWAGGRGLVGGWMGGCIYVYTYTYTHMYIHSFAARRVPREEVGVRVGSGVGSS